MDGKVQSLYPPKVPLTVRIGVTGHRDAGLSDSIELQEAIREVLDLVRQLSDDLHREMRGSRAVTSQTILRVISPLAEGVDQLVAGEAVERKFELHCPLPFPRAVCEASMDRVGAGEPFRRLISGAQAVLELDGSLDHKDEAYEAAGLVVLRQSDLLLAVWDGKEARGVGGTGQIVKEALRLEIPVVCINPASPRDLRFLRSADRRESPGDLGDLYDHLKAALLPPPVSSSAFSPMLIEYWARLFRPGVRAGRSSMKQWDSSWSEGRETPPKIREHVDKFYRSRFVWADTWAKRYAFLYRSSWITNYILGAVAVLGAFLALEDPGFWTRVEFVVVLVIFAMTLLGRRFKWHQRWMDCRLLAEGLRQMQVLTLFARTTPSFRVPVFMERNETHQNWADWYLRTVAREAGFSHTAFSGDHLLNSRRVFVSWAQAQAAYHGEKEVGSRSVHDKLSFLSSSFFVLAALACGLHLIPAIHSIEAKVETKAVSEFLNLVVLVFPAFGASTAAILHHGEFERMSFRSQSLGARLRDLSKQIANPARRKTSGQLGDAVEEICQIMLSELSDFRYVFLDKSIDLPS